jgi:lipoprotein-releasing system ATP-binding protein
MTPADANRDDPVLVQAVEMSKSFVLGTREIKVLDRIDLTLTVGEVVSIVGKSGTGKSTLLHCMGTLDLPSSGQILFGGVDIVQLSPPELARFRNRTIGFVFQFHHLLPEFTALENVMMPAMVGRRPTKEAREQAEEILEAVGVAHRLHHRPGELSGGEQQRVAIARALVMHPKLLLADEPTGNLDTRTSEEVHELLLRLNEEHQITMLLVTHNMELAYRSPRVIRMADGRLIRDETQDGKDARSPVADDAST